MQAFALGLRLLEVFKRVNWLETALKIEENAVLDKFFTGGMEEPSAEVSGKGSWRGR